MRQRMPDLDPCILADPNIEKELLQAWERWSGLFPRRVFSHEGREYLLAWFERDVEDEVDREFGRSPSLGYAKHCLAVCALVEETGRFDPTAVKKGCSMAPKVSRSLKEKAESLGFALNDDGSPKRRFAVFTFRQDEKANNCGACRLYDSCASTGRER